jgi:dTMP kinase
MSKGLYIVIEGQDGTGKNTQVDKLADYFRAQNRPVSIVHEGDRDDSGLPSTTEISRIIKNRDYDIDPLAFVLFFTGMRVELWQKIIAPALAADGVVLAARNWWSTLAFQGYGQGVDLAKIEQITRDYLPERYQKPDFGVILTLDDAEKARRVKTRDDKHLGDIFETQPNDFQTRVNHGYEQIAKSHELPLIDASGTIDEVQQKIIDRL